MATTKTEVTGSAQGAAAPGAEAVARVKKSESILDRTLRLLSSVRFGVTMLVIVLICCIIGMLVMQKDVQGFEEYFARRTPAERTIFGALGFYDIYHAWYFTGLLAVTGLNIILASIDRFPSAWKFIAKPNFKQTPKALTHMMLKDQAEVGEEPKELAERIESAWRNNPVTRAAVTWQRVLMVGQTAMLMGLLLYILPPGLLRWVAGLVTVAFLVVYVVWGLGYKYKITKEEGRTTIFAENNSWNRLGAYLVHVALLTLFVGGVLTSRFSTGGIMEIRPGVSTRNYSTFEMVRKNGRWEREIGEAKTPFDVVCTDLQQKLIRPEAGLDTMNTIDWLSYVTIKDSASGKEIPAKIHMNNPFDYRGYRLFQSQFNPVGNARSVKVIFKPVSAAEPIEVEIPRNGTVDIEGIGSVSYVQFLPDYIRTAEGPTSASPDYNNPVAVLTIDDKQAVMAFNLQLAERVLTARGKSEDGATGEDNTVRVNGLSYVVLLKEFEKASLTHSLEVRRDPGQNPFYIGSMLLLLALGCVFFFSHERVWAVIEPDGKGSKVYFGGNTNRNKPAFEGRYRSLVESVIGGGKKMSRAIKREEVMGPGVWLDFQDSKTWLQLGVAVLYLAVIYMVTPAGSFAIGGPVPFNMPWLVLTEGMALILMFTAIRAKFWVVVSPIALAIVLIFARLTYGQQGFLYEGALTMLALISYITAGVVLVTNLFVKENVLARLGLLAVQAGYCFNLSGWMVRWIEAGERKAGRLEQSTGRGDIFR